MALFFLFLWLATVSFMASMTYWSSMRDLIWDILIYSKAKLYFILEKWG